MFNTKWENTLRFIETYKSLTEQQEFLTNDLMFVIYKGNAKTYL